MGDLMMMYFCLKVRLLCVGVLYGEKMVRVGWKFNGLELVGFLVWGGVGWGDGLVGGLVLLSWFYSDEKVVIYDVERWGSFVNDKYYCWS